MTTKLYWNDSHLTTFTARVLDCYGQEGASIVILDQTAFYPTGGGQPHDIGVIGCAPVGEVTISDDGTILHHLAAAFTLHKGEEVLCQVDRARRLDLTQQHTGQHILSQAFFQLFGAETRGFRINPDASEIDLTLDAPADSIPQAIQQAEELANRIVFENRTIRTHLVTPEEAAKLPLRKESFIADCVRVVEIGDYDWSACGGTHARQTGEVGLIAVKGSTRAKKMTRVEFLCGGRALRDYRLAHTTAETIARQFSVGREAAPESVRRLSEENKRLAQRVRVLAGLAAKAEAEALLKTAPLQNGLRVVCQTFADRSFDELKLLAHELVAGKAVLALLAVREEALARLVFARSPDVPADMGSLMRDACQRLDGKGGGTAEFAQGGGVKIAELETVLQSIAQQFA
jgi:alanyl-tRNA synthetase